MNTKKIEVLNKAIQMLENGFDYEWTSLTRCNCGVVVAASLSRPPAHEEAMHSVNRVGLWKAVDYSFDDKCPVTGLRIGLIQQSLLGAGFNQKDISDLEELNNNEIVSKILIKAPDYPRQKHFYEVKENLIQYLRAWVSILEEQDQKEQPKEVVKTVYIRVAVPASISEQAKELIEITETIAR